MTRHGPGLGSAAVRKPQAMESNTHCDLFAKLRGVVPEPAPSASAMEHAWAPEENAFLLEEDKVELFHAGGGQG